MSIVNCHLGKMEGVGECLAGLTTYTKENSWKKNHSFLSPYVIYISLCFHIYIYHRPKKFSCLYQILRMTYQAHLTYCYHFMYGT